jgi:hypothetical protein
MAVASYNKFQQHVKNMLDAYLSGQTFKVYLSNETPLVTDTIKADIAEIGSGNGYTAGGNTTTITSSIASGVAKATGTDPTTWTASGGSIGPFRYAVLYNDTSASDSVVSWWDYGSSITLQTGETFSVDLDATNGVFTIT